MSDRDFGDEGPLPGMGGVILCGGRSRRMGLPKAGLPFGPECLLERVVRLVGRAVDPLVVVAAAEQSLPPLPPDVLLTHDQQPDRGPLEGMEAGLTALAGLAQAAFVTSCDVPLLVPAFIRALAQHLGDHQIVVPVEDRFAHPLAAIYRLTVRDNVRRLLERDRLRPAFLFEEVDTRRLPVDLLRHVDPHLLTLKNLNTPQDYLDALRMANATAPPEILARLSRSGSAPPR